MTFERIVLNNVFRNISVYIGYLISSIFSVASFFILTMICYHPSLNEYYSIDMILPLKEVIYIITIFYIIYFLKMFIKSKKREFGIYLTLGIDKKQIRKILFIENMAIGFLALVIGIAFGIVFSKFFLVIISNILESDELKFYLPLKAIISTVLRYMILFYIIPIVMGKITKYSSIYDLINNKKEENTRIKVSLIKSLISLIVIIFGYCLVFSINIANVFSIRLLIILIVFVLGNYLFFNYIINYILDIVSKCKKIYLNKTNFLFISSLKYRIYDNISMLFVVTLLLAVSFSSIGTVYIQKSVLKRDVVKNSPFSLNYIVKDYSNYEKDEEFIDEILNDNGISYNKIKLYILTIPNENKTYNIIKESQYNNIVSIIKRKPVYINEKESIIVPKYEDIQNNEKNLIGKEINLYKDVRFIVKSSAEGCIATKGILSNTFIICDKDFDSICNKYNKRLFIGYEVKEWEKIKLITKKIDIEAKNRNMDNLFISRMYLYDSEKAANSVAIYFTFFIGTILYLAAVSFMNYKFYVELKQEQNKYANMISLGVTFNELKRIISREMLIVFFVPFMIAVIDAVFAYRILYVVYDIPILVPIIQILIAFFIINLLFFLFWRYKNVNFLCSK